MGWLTPYAAKYDAQSFRQPTAEDILQHRPWPFRLDTCRGHLGYDGKPGIDKDSAALAWYFIYTKTERQEI